MPKDYYSRIGKDQPASVEDDYKVYVCRMEESDKCGSFQKKVINGIYQMVQQVSGGSDHLSRWIGNAVMRGKTRDVFGIIPR